MSVPELLLNSLEEMLDEEFKKFKWHLTMNVLDDYDKIPRAQLEHADRTDTVSKIIQNYKEEGAVKATVTILRKLRMNDLAERLLKAETLSTASSNPSSSGVNPSSPGVTPAAAGPSLSAKDGGVIIAPILTNSNPGTWSIAFNKNQ